MKDNRKEMNKIRLQEIAKLPDNWNGYGAKSFPEQVIKNTETVLEALDISPEIFPTACNTVQLEYEKENRDYLEVEIGKDINHMEVFQYDKDNNEETVIVHSIPELNKKINDFYKKGRG